MTDKIDLSHVFLLIATPSMDGKYEASFTESLRATEKLITQLGGKFDFIRMSYCADIGYARARLFGEFYRYPKATHLLQIDADMGWDPNDVVKMLLLKTEFIAIAGPRKQYPLDAIDNYAFALRDDYNNPILLYHTLETNVAEVSEVGGAFVMISRGCADKMVRAYSDLEFESTPNTTDWDLYQPIIVNAGKEYGRRRLSEDYAFCRRWRLIGGKVEVLLDGRLSHTGSHKFEGRLYDALFKNCASFGKPNGHVEPPQVTIN